MPVPSSLHQRPASFSLEQVRTPANSRLHFPCVVAWCLPLFASIEDDPRLLRLPQALFWSLVILLIFLVAALVIIRFSVRFRNYLLRKERKPTPSEDVWTMHKLPRDENLNLPENDEDDTGPS